MSKGYKTTLSFITILFLVCCSLGIAYLFYDKTFNESTLVLVDGNLSINYLNGNEIKNKGIESYEMKVSITNNSKEYVSYSINLENVKNKSDNVNMIIKNTTINSVINNLILPKEDGNLVKNIQIASGETHNYLIELNSKLEDKFSGVLKVVEEKTEITTFAQTILSSNAISNNTLTSVAEEAATVDEGLISDIDDMGSTYYFRGAVKNNYVSFANLTWRIVRINGDGTVKLILNSVLDTVQPFYTNTDGEFYKYDNSKVKEYLSTWYDYNLKEYDSYIALDRYCNDYNTTNDTDYIYQSYVRNVTNKIPTFNCLGKNIGTKIGLITADEVIYAGGILESANQEYYLYNKDFENSWWTMTPAKGTETEMKPFIINTDGSLNHNVVGTYNRGVRPVISLIEELEVTGSGTETNPYKIVMN